MITFEVFLVLLMAVSVFTSLVVEGIKKFLGEKYKAPANLMTGIVAIVLGAIVGVCYCILTEIAFSLNIIIMLVALVFLSWLCAMVGYDKVVQAFTQLKVTK